MQKKKSLDGDDVDTTQTIISFCTGYGGIELGLEAAGLSIKPVAYVERDAYAAANLVAKIEANRLVAAPIWSDVATFPSEQFRGKIHGIVAGYPCQPFSLAGKRRGGGRRAMALGRHRATYSNYQAVMVFL